MSIDRVRRGSGGVRGGRGKGAQGKTTSGKKSQPNEITSMKTLEPKEDDEQSIESVAECVTCNRTFTDSKDQLLSCERCLDWYCIKCVGMNDNEYTIMSRKDVHWFCETCNQPALQAVFSDKAVEDKCKEFLSKFECRLETVEQALEQKASRQDVTSIESQVRDLEKKVEEVKSTQDGMGSQLKQNATDAANQGTEEMEDQDRRKANIVVFGVNESKASDATERKEHDTQFMKNMCDKGLGVSVNVKQVRRLGRRSEDVSENNTKPRPMLATLGSKEEVTEALKASKKLREHDTNSTFHSLSLKQDMTPFQRDRMRNLVALRNQKREEAKDKGETAQWVIRGNKVVNMARNQQEARPRKGEENQ